MNFSEPHASELGFRHPALVIQRDEVTASRINTVVVCVLTSNKAHAKAPGNTLLSSHDTGLPRDSVANASQIATVDKADFDTLVGVIPPRAMNAVNEGLRWFLALGEG